MSERRIRATVLASGGGTNLQTVIDASARGEIAVVPSAVIVNRAHAFAAERARRAGIAVQTIEWDRGAETRAAYDARLLDAVAATQPQLVLLLGWMHLLAPPFIERFPELVNIHPAFLPLDTRSERVDVPDGTTIPAYRGAHAIRDAIANRSRWYGATVHRVTNETDRGAVLARCAVPLEDDDEANALAALRPVEAQTLVQALQLWSARYAGSRER